MHVCRTLTDWFRIQQYLVNYIDCYIRVYHPFSRLDAVREGAPVMLAQFRTQPWLVICLKLTHLTGVKISTFQHD